MTCYCDGYICNACYSKYQYRLKQLELDLERRRQFDKVRKGTYTPGDLLPSWLCYTGGGTGS